MVFLSKSRSSRDYPENLNEIKTIINVPHLCTLQNIPLHGHRDDGSLLDTRQSRRSTSVTDVNDDKNLRAILRHTAAKGSDAL